MANPYMQFWVNDWLGCMEVRALTPAARALWMDMICFMQNAPNRGFLQFENGDPITTEELARMTGYSVDDAENHIKEMRRKNVFSETEAGVIYCRRMVKEAKLSEIRSKAAKSGWQNNASPDFADANPNANPNANPSAKANANGQAKTMQIPGNPFPSPVPIPKSSIDDVAQVRNWLVEYLSAFGIAAGSPDESICRRIIAACNGRPLADLQSFLIAKCKARQRPSKSWAWFEAIVRSEFSDA